MSYINETDFVIENKQLVYPEIVTDGLQLYYDAKGKRDTDYHRDTMLDMSGNKNHGKLHNFAYEKHSGYKDGLVFDYIDDKLVRPELDGIDENNFTYQLNSNIIAFTRGEVKTVKNGSVEVGGRNYWVIAEANEHKVRAWASGALGTEENSLSSGLIPTKPNEQFVINYTGINQTLYYNKDKEYIGAFGMRMATPSSGADYQYSNTSGRPMDDTPAYVVYTFRYNFIRRNPDYRIMLEKGSKSTDWTPAPEDLIKTAELKGNILGDMENIIDGLYKTEVLSGEEIYTDKADDAVVHVEIDGKSYQHAGGGKNLFAVPYPDALKDFIRPVDYWVRPITLKANTQYTISSKLIGNRIEGTTVMVWNGGDQYADRGRSYPTLNASGTHRTYEFNTEGMTEWKIAIFLTSDLESSKEVLGELLDNYQFQLEEGSVVTEYEPPAPTPEYPIKIYSLNDFDVVSSVGKRNYVLNSEQNLTNQNSRYMNLSKDLTISLVKKYGFTGSIDIEVVNHKILEIYKFNRLGFEIGIIDSNGSTGYHQINIYPNEGEDFRERISRYVAPIENWARITRLGMWIQTGGDKVYVGNPKITIGDNTQDVWIPAPEDITENDNHPLIDKINLLLDEPLRSVGDVKDRLFRDTDGLWKIERKTTERIISGGMLSYRYRLGAQGINTFYNSNFPNAKTGYLTSVSSHFKNVRGGWDHHEHGIGYSDHTSTVNKYFYFPDSLTGIIESDSTSIATQKINNWLALNPISVVYQLANPVIETLPQSLQDKLNNLRTFKDSNYIYTVLPDGNNNTSSNLKPTLHAKFLYNNWYKEDRVINNLMIYNRALTNEEMLQNYKTIKRRWRM